MRTVKLVLVIVMAGLLTGCSSRPSFMAPKSRVIGQETINRIEPGVSTSDWVYAVLGRPTDVVSLQDSPGEIWKYRYKLISGGSYRLHARSSDGGSSRMIYIHFDKEIVSDVWMD